MLSFKKRISFFRDPIERKTGAQPLFPYALSVRQFPLNLLRHICRMGQ